MVERRAYNPSVGGSSPSTPTKCHYAKPIRGQLFGAATTSDRRPLSGSGRRHRREFRANLREDGAIEVHIAGLQADGEFVPEEVGAPQLLAVTVAA